MPSISTPRAILASRHVPSGAEGWYPLVASQPLIQQGHRRVTVLQNDFPRQPGENKTFEKHELEKVPESFYFPVMPPSSTLQTSRRIHQKAARSPGKLLKASMAPKDDFSDKGFVGPRGQSGSLILSTGGHERRHAAICSSLIDII